MFSRVVAQIAVITVLVGWIAFGQQLSTDGWTSGDGTVWLLILAIVATIGTGLALPALRTGRHLVAAIGLLLAAASPTVFAYPLNVAVLVFACVEIALSAIRGSRRGKSPGRAVYRALR